MALVGAHVSIQGGLPSAFARGDLLGCEAIQIFTKNQLQWYRSPVSEQESERFLNAWKNSSVKEVVCHASYLINLCGCGAVAQKSLEALVQEIDRCAALCIDNMVVHPGFHLDMERDKALTVVCRGLYEALSRTENTHVRLLVETMAGQGTVLGSSLDECYRIYDSIGDTRRVGLCLDTCHLHAAGYNISTPDGYERLVNHIERGVGVEAVGCWHLNESKDERGSGKDRHAHVGSGTIGNVPFSMIVSDRRFTEIPAILETSSYGNEASLSMLRKWRGA